MKQHNKDKMTLTKLAKIVIDGFNRVDTRIDKIEARLDYIVKANNLKDSKESQQ